MKIFFDFSLDFFADIKKRYTFAPVKRNTQRESVVKCGNSSVGRAQPCPKEKRFPTLARNAKLNEVSRKCGNSSVGRAQPCQGWGREFEPRFPLSLKF